MAKVVLSLGLDDRRGAKAPNRPAMLRGKSGQHEPPCFLMESGHLGNWMVRASATENKPLIMQGCLRKVGHHA